MLKQLSSSGVLLREGDRGRRRRSSAANAAGSYTFQHLCIFDCVHERMLQEQTQRLHALCAKALSGRGIDLAALAHHHDRGGMPWEAAQLFHRVAMQMREQQASVAGWCAETAPASSLARVPALR